MASSNNEDRETFYSPLPGNRAGSDDEDEAEPVTPPPPRFPTTLELVRSVLREESTEDGFGSLNYDPFTSDASLSEARKYTPAKKRILLGYSGRTFWRWSITACLGIVTGCVAVALSQLTNAIVAHRRSRFGTDPSTMRSCILFDCLLACLAAGATTLLAPGAAGSGIPVVKAYLNGVRVRGCLSPKCFLVKFFGTAMVRRRRPFVRIYAIDARRLGQRRRWVVSFSNLGPFGPRCSARRPSAPARRWARKDPWSI